MEAEIIRYMTLAATHSQEVTEASIYSTLLDVLDAQMPIQTTSHLMEAQSVIQAAFTRLTRAGCIIFSGSSLRLC